MQYTTHYNLMLPEGGDIVNPLVQQNPNFSDIDAAMFANKQSVVGSATELTAGTVHTITRANTDSNIIRFTATSNWTAGDSMAIDSTPVSVFLSDGTAPGTGAYIINTEVLAILSGTRVTLITSKTGLTASDVDTLIDAALAPVVLADVVADGVKTFKVMLNEAYAQIDQTKLTMNSILEYNGSYLRRRSGLNYIGGSIGSYFNTTEYDLDSTDSVALTVRVALDGTGNVTLLDHANTVVAAGRHIIVYA